MQTGPARHSIPGPARLPNVANPQRGRDGAA